MANKDSTQSEAFVSHNKILFFIIQFFLYLHKSL